MQSPFHVVGSSCAQNTCLRNCGNGDFLSLYSKQDMLETSINKLLGASLMTINMQQIWGQLVRELAGSRTDRQLFSHLYIVDVGMVHIRKYAKNACVCAIRLVLTFN